MFTFIQSPAFERLRAVYLDDDEYADLQQFVIRNPQAGGIARGSRGCQEIAREAAGHGQAGRSACDLFRLLRAE